MASVTLLRENGGAILEAFSPVLTGASTALDPKIARAALRRAVAGKAAPRSCAARRADARPSSRSRVYARVVVPLRARSPSASPKRVGGTGFSVLVDGEGRSLSSDTTPRGLDLPPCPPGRSRAALASATAASARANSSTPRAWPGSAPHAPVPVLGGAVLVLQSREEPILPPPRPGAPPASR